MFPISFISRETGISAATLRKWEQRYGFPKPDRENNRRTYSEEELTSLREIKRLLDQGARPSIILSDSTRFTAPLSVCSLAHNKQTIFIETALGLLIEHRVRELCLLLEKKLKKLGTFRFVNEVAEPLTVVVGDNWANGTISIFAEHCYTTQMYNNGQKPWFHTFRMHEYDPAHNSRHAGGRVTKSLDPSTQRQAV